MKKRTPFGYKVEIQSYPDYEPTHDSDGNWSSSYTNTFISVKKSDRYPSIVSSLDIKESEPCFVVWLEYSTGDSFGGSNNGNTDCIGIFRDKKSAQELVTALNGVFEDQGNLKLTTSDGQSFDVVVSHWTGYFESLGTVFLSPAVMAK